MEDQDDNHCNFGQAKIPKARFDNPNGTAMKIDADFL